SQARPGFFGFARPDPSTSLCRNSRSCGATLRQTAEGGRLRGGIARAQSFIAFSGPQAHGYSGQAHEGARPHVSIAPKEDFSFPTVVQKPMQAQDRLTRAPVPT